MEQKTESIRLYCGQEPRESVGLHVFIESVLEKASLPVEIVVLTPKIGESLGISSDGSNAFSKLRFAVPYLNDFRGFAIWADGSDMLARADLAELWELRSGWDAVQVVKHNYETKHPVKYIGTDLEAGNTAYPRKNWSSLCIWNCGHYLHKKLNPAFIAEQPGSYLHRFGWVPDDRIGELPEAFNHLVGEFPHNPEAKIAHMTLGLPGFEHYKQCDYAKEWTDALKAGARGLQYR